MLKRLFNNGKLRWYLLILAIFITIVLFLPMNYQIKKLRDQELKNVQTWSNAVKTRSDIANRASIMFERLNEYEKQRLEEFIQAYKIIISQDEDANLASEDLAFYTKIITNNTSIPVIITDEFHNILLSQNVVGIDSSGGVLFGNIKKEFEQNPPFEYEIFGMKFFLYYTHSKTFFDLKQIVDDLNKNLLHEITHNNVFIPIMLTDSTKTGIIYQSNVPYNKINTQENIHNYLKTMTNYTSPIKINLQSSSYGYVFYKQSNVLTILKYYPLLQSFVIFIIILLFYNLYRIFKDNQRTNVMIGMAKETAHQLGTPISALYGWNELLKNEQQNTTICKEIDKDLTRLSTVSNRFSLIGSKVELKNSDITLILYDTITYMSKRIPKNIILITDIDLSENVDIKLNSVLLSWALENLIKNAVDAMPNGGNLTIKGYKNNNSYFIDIIDSGKGIKKSDWKNVFQAGFTTKKRGWGMGLALVKRIICQYHNGDIYIKNSRLQYGTTFTIKLNL